MWDSAFRQSLLIAVVFVLSLGAQLAITPLNEGMDFGGHLAYIDFVRAQHRPPLPDEPSVGAWVDRLTSAMPGPDFTDGTHYQAWAALTSAERAQHVAQAVQSTGTANQYVTTNYQAQHPPLYYFLLSIPDNWLGQAPIAVRVYGLELVSILIAAVALPAIYLTFRRYTQDGRTAAIGTLAVAWFPNLLAFLGRLTNDALAFPLIAWSMYLIALPNRRLPRVVGAGILLGLACFTKTYALALVPIYLLSSCFTRDDSGPVRATPRLAAVALACSVLTIGPLLLVNYLISGQVVLLTEVRASAEVPVLERLRAILAVPPLWFATGLVQYFWWSGYWSFVVRGFLYIPLVAVPIVVLAAVTSPRRFRVALARVWPHLAVVVCFVVALLLHAALLRERFGGGNEGWYADVLIGSVFAVGLVLLQVHLSPRGLRAALAIGVGIFIVWNLLGRVVMLLFWTGQYGPGGTLAAGPFAAVSGALRALVNTGDGDPLIPGGFAPTWLTFGLPLVLSLAITGRGVWSLTRDCAGGRHSCEVV